VVTGTQAACRSPGAPSHDCGLAARVGRCMRPDLSRRLMHPAPSHVPPPVPCGFAGCRRGILHARVHITHTHPAAWRPAYCKLPVIPAMLILVSNLPAEWADAEGHTGTGSHGTAVASPCQARRRCSPVFDASRMQRCAFSNRIAGTRTCGSERRNGDARCCATIATIAAQGSRSRTRQAGRIQGF
jgi:hypothetical protein